MKRIIEADRDEKGWVDPKTPKEEKSSSQEKKKMKGGLK